MRTRGVAAHVPEEPRPVRDTDSQDLFGLLALCFSAYPGCFVDPHDDLADLREPERAMDREGRAFWAVEDETGRVCACVAVDEPEPGVAELHRLYVRPDRRRRGLAGRLLRLAEDHARAAGARRIVLWSDTRFEAAHRLYEAAGYRRTAAVRALGDISASVEQHYVKVLPSSREG